jgi:methylated-DNA-[protein]-cysteine S-methyltransferase
MNETGRDQREHPRKRLLSLSMPSPAGMLTLCERNGAIVALDIAARPEKDAGKHGRGHIKRKTTSPLLTRARRQIEEYFAGTRQRFDLPLAPSGTSFQRSVWRLLRTVPYGETRSYGELAHTLGSSPRAVGRANATNPLPILIPCHRVIGHNGALVGYSGGEGISTKRRLLELEGIRLAETGP